MVTQCCGELVCDISENLAVSFVRPNECTLTCVNFFFNDTASNSDCGTSNRWMIGNTGLYGMQKGVIAAQFKVLSRYSPG